MKRKKKKTSIERVSLITLQLHLVGESDTDMGIETAAAVKLVIVKKYWRLCEDFLYHHPVINYRERVL